MPYLTFAAPRPDIPLESSESSKEKAISRSEMQSPHGEQGKMWEMGKNPEVENPSIVGDEAVTVPNLHDMLMKEFEVVQESRTLDQYYYSSLENTDYRDSTQVITRYLERKRANPRILRVDQLWLLIIDESMFVSSAPTGRCLLTLIFRNDHHELDRPTQR
jgi:hypothetical protein